MTGTPTPEDAARTFMGHAIVSPRREQLEDLLREQREAGRREGGQADPYEELDEVLAKYDDLWDTFPNWERHREDLERELRHVMAIHARQHFNVKVKAIEQARREGAETMRGHVIEMVCPTEYRGAPPEHGRFRERLRHRFRLIDVDAVLATDDQGDE